MMISVLCESPQDRHPQEKCASKCVRGIDLSAFILFFNITIFILHAKSKEQSAAAFALRSFLLAHKSRKDKLGGMCG